MKLTAVGCDCCGETLTFQNWSRLWRTAKSLGWIRGTGNDEHFCSEACRAEFEMRAGREKRKEGAV